VRTNLGGSGAEPNRIWTRGTDYKGMTAKVREFPAAAGFVFALHNALRLQ